jgi:D-hydroxyproline dehydrogenase subunit gamma
MKSSHAPLPPINSAEMPLFRALSTLDQPLNVVVDGVEVAGQAAETVAALLLRIASPDSFRRSAVTDLARAPLCMMGVCFECLVEIDGQTNQQGCLFRLQEGMQIRRQNRQVLA